jgi:hypothetical protein
MIHFGCDNCDDCRFLVIDLDRRITSCSSILVRRVIIFFGSSQRKPSRLVSNLKPNSVFSFRGPNSILFFRLAGVYLATTVSLILLNYPYI